MLTYKHNNVFSDVEKTLHEHYKDNPNFDDALFVLGYNVLPSLNGLKQKYPNHRIIIYQLEQLYNGSPWACKRCADMLASADEVWDYDTQNIAWMRSNFNIHAKYVPLLYTNALKFTPDFVKESCDIDVLFYGYLSERRTKLLMHLNHASNMKLKIIMLNGVWGKELDSYITRTKIILNIHVEQHSRQEQVRIYYPVINNRCVLSEKSPTNHFGDAIVEMPYEKLLDGITYLLNNDKWADIAINAGESYKKLCFKN